MATAQVRLNQILPSWYDLLTKWSLDGSLVAAATDALMLDSSNAKQDAKGQLHSYLSQWSAGNFKNLPPIVLLSANDINNAYGAYAVSTGTIYLNQDWVASADAVDIVKVLTEEIGHYLDNQLNNNDTLGDEGEFFAELLTATQISDEHRAALRNESDAGFANASGSVIQVENSALSGISLVGKIVTQNVEQLFSTAVLGSKLYHSVNSNGRAAILVTDASLQQLDLITDDRYLPNVANNAYYKILTYGSDKLLVRGCVVNDQGKNITTLRMYDTTQGKFLWTYDQDPASNGVGALTIQGQYAYLGGSTTLSGTNQIFKGGAGDAYLEKIDLLTGQSVLFKTYGSSGTDYTYKDIHSDSTGIYMQSECESGSFEGLPSSFYDSIVYKLDFNGNIIWKRNIGVPSYDGSSGVVVRDGIVYVSGFIDNPTPDARIIALDATTGTTLWQAVYGGSGGAENATEIEIIGDKLYACVIDNLNPNSIKIIELDISSPTDSTKNRIVNTISYSSLDEVDNDWVDFAAVDGSAYMTSSTTTGSYDVYMLKLNGVGITQSAAPKYINGNSFYTTTDGPTWQDSQNNAQALGGNLVTINDLTENQFVFDNFVRGVPIWIGFTDQVQEGVWKWISGDTSTFTNWEPNRPDNYLDQDYGSMGWSNGTEPRWEDARNGESVVTGVAEIPVTASITSPTTIKEASGVFTTTINITAGSLLSGNLLNGLLIYWEITGITQQDLDSLSPNGLTGTGVITNGQIQIQHSLVDDGVYEVESFQVRIFSDPNRQCQIGSASSTAIVDKTIDTGDAIFRINGNGTGVETQSLTCILSQIDPDGMVKLPPSQIADPTNGYAYQWQVSSDGISWTNAVGTGANTFKYSVNLTLDTNKFLRVQVGYTDDKGFTETIFTDSVRILSGSTKNDSLKGTAAVEVFFSGSGADAVATGAGNDFAKGGIGNDTFTGIDGDGDDFFDGQSEIDTISYSASSTGVDIDFVTGLATGRVDGGIGKDSFAGIENAQGTRGDDIFNGNLGLNRFTGVGGNDTFKFMNKQLGASACDHITDFSADTIALSKSAFGLPSTFTNTSSNFFASVSGTKAVNASAASIVYDIGSGYLYLNTDGAVSGQGTGGGVIAILDNKAALISSNFVLL